MDSEKLQLTDHEYEELNRESPRGKGSALIGKRAEKIIRIHFRRKDPRCEFKHPKNGADLHVVFSDNEESLTLEIKGTDEAGIAWQKLKVSSKHSWRLLTEEKIPLYRVTDVFGQIPVIYVLIHDRDFELEPEPRWSIKRKSTSAHQRDIFHLKEPNSTQNGGGVSDSRSKYHALTNFLESQHREEIMLPLSEASEILGFALPASAKKYQAFWANQSDTKNRPWARAWQEAGFRVDSIHLSETNGWVLFKRVSKTPNHRAVSDAAKSAAPRTPKPLSPITIMGNGGCMLITHGGKARRFEWKYQGNETIITNENGRTHLYSVGEIYDIINWLTQKFGADWFPLANNVEKLGNGKEVDGLGVAILRQGPKNITHAQGSSYLGVVLEQLGILEWNHKAKGIKYRIIHRPNSIDELKKIMNAKAA
jgi:hypothetical protein